MLDYLKEKRDAGFFKSLSGLMQSCRYRCIKWSSCAVGARLWFLSLTFEVFFCSVLDLNAFERQNKAEGLGMVTEEGSSE